MSLAPQDAIDALRAVDETDATSRTLHGYSVAAPHMILWGCAYAAGYSYGYLRPENAGAVWLVLVPLAIIGDVMLSGSRESGAKWQIFAGLMATFLAFIVATGAIMQPHDPRQMAAFVPILVGCCYIVLGIGAGRRLVLTGIALFALTLLGFFAFPSIFLLWMAVVGGGGLILGGLWLRQV